MSEFKLNVPVLFLIFNRPDTTQRVFNEIRKAAPPKLFVSADGPRENKPGEFEKCQATRDIIKHVDWDCEVFTNFRDKNSGCKIAVSSGISWFYENVEEGIILEDDCLPCLSFFRFCEELLEKYRDDERIMQIGGTNLLNGWQRDDSSYYFSQYGAIWGWASWRRAWKHYDVNMKLWPEVKAKKMFFDWFDHKREIQFWLNIYDKVYLGQIDTWDYQWDFAKRINLGLGIVPKVNLVSNIGFREDATHTKDKKHAFAELECLNIEFPLRYPKVLRRNKISDNRFFDTFIKQSFLKRVISKLKRFKEEFS